MVGAWGATVRKVGLQHLGTVCQWGGREKKEARGPRVLPLGKGKQVCIRRHGFQMALQGPIRSITGLPLGLVMRQGLPSALGSHSQVLSSASMAALMWPLPTFPASFGTALPTHFPFWRPGLFILRHIKFIPASASLSFCPLFSKCFFRQTSLLRAAGKCPPLVS